MSYTSERRDQLAIFHLNSTLNADEIAQLREEFWHCFTRDHITTVVVDLGNEPLKPSSISLLAGAQNLAAKEKGRLFLVGGGTEAQTTLEEFNLTTYFHHHESLDQLLAQIE